MANDLKQPKTQHEESILKHFTREPPIDVWMCISEADITISKGHVKVLPGQQFMPGTEIAHLLDEAERQARTIPMK